MKIGVVTADFNSEITHKMEKIAVKHAHNLNAKVVKRIHVPGVFEIPYAVDRLLHDDGIDGVATLGAVITGDTGHDKVVASNAARKIMDLSIEFHKPVSLGIIGPKVTWQQALDRHEGYARRSVEAVVNLLSLEFRKV